jgi:hypothetical protein
MHIEGSPTATLLAVRPDPAIDGIYRISDIYGELKHIRVKGLDTGVVTGWQSLDEYYKVKKGMVSIVTGIPQSGKSEFIDALIVNLAECHSWKFAIFSPENFPLSLHAIKIAEKHIGKQFQNNLFGYVKRTIRKRAVIYRRLFYMDLSERNRKDKLGIDS